MKSRAYLTIFGCYLFTSISALQSAPLAPNDPTIADSLVSWHRDAASNYTEGLWKATVGKDLVTLGEAEDGSDEFIAPELESYTPEEGFFAGLEDVRGVLFSAEESDMLWVEEAQGGDPFEELTLIGVYQTTGNTDRTRPVGLGSWTESQGRNNFNLSSDASLRYDNGNNRTDPTLHLPDLTFRAGVLSEGLVWDYLDGDVITEEAVPGGSFEGVTRNDNLFVGDVRGGLIEPFTATDPHDIFVAEVILYKSALSDAQITGISEWLQANLTGSTSDPCDFDGDGELGLGDIQLLSTGIQAGDAAFDVNGDGTTNVDDLNQFVTSSEKLNSYIGDANLDGEFNSSDFVLVFQGGLFETNQPASWRQGDWNADGVFGSGDFVAAFQDGGFELGAKAIATVPEPASIVLLLIGLTTLIHRSRSSM